MKNQPIILMLLFVCAIESLAQQKIQKAYLKQEVEVYLPSGGETVNTMELFIKDGHVRTESKQGPMSSIMLYSDADKSLTVSTDMQGAKEGGFHKTL